MKKLRNYLAILLSVFLISCTASMEEIYEWRGVNRTGIYEEVNLLKEWPEEGPEEIWVIESIGNGYGSPVIDGEHIFITGEIDSMAHLFCFDLNGKEKWQFVLGNEWTESYPGSRSAPTVVGDLLYVGTGMGNLYCIRKEVGELLWMKDFKDDFNGAYPMFGHSEAPVIYENMVFWTPGGEIHNVVALNRHTGDLIWSNKGFGERSGYNQPKLIEFPGRKIFVTFSAYHMMGFDVETGEMLWSHEQDNYPPEKRGPGYGDTHSNTILYEDGYIYYAEGDGNCGIKLKLTDDGSGIRELWCNKGFDGYMGGIVKIDDHLYGGGTLEQDLISINAESGEIAGRLNIGRGVVIAADDMLYYYNHRGEMMLIDYDQGKMEQICSFKINKGSKEHFSHPVIHNGVLYLRHGNALMAYDIAL